MNLLGWIFGKAPLVIFTKEGRLHHQHPEKKWSDWEARFLHNPNANWKNHSGFKTHN